MTRYKVLKPFTELGIHHEVGTVIIDTSLIQNLQVKLWDGTLEEVKEEQKATATSTPVNKADAKIPAKPSKK